MLQRVRLADIICCQTGYNPATGRVSAIGKDFVYRWDPVRESAMQRGLNLDSFLLLPIAARLSEKKLRSPVLFWFTPMNDVFVVTVTSKRNVDFMDPFHSLPGYAEYGEDYMRPHSRPIVYWDGETVIRTHPVLDATTQGHLVADLGNLSGLTVAGSSAEQYKEILENPVDYFEYLAVPEASEQQVCNWNGTTFTVRHALCIVR